MHVGIKQSKTDLFHKGINIFIGHTGTNLCQIAVLLDYLRMRRSAPRPLFMFVDVDVLSPDRISWIMCKKPPLDQVITARVCPCLFVMHCTYSWAGRQATWARLSACTHLACSVTLTYSPVVPAIRAGYTIRHDKLLNASKRVEHTNYSIPTLFTYCHCIRKRPCWLQCVYPFKQHGALRKTYMYM